MLGTGYPGQLGSLLPIDVLTTHCPDHQAAAAGFRRPSDFLDERITMGIAQEPCAGRHRLESRLQSLLAHH
ncbi:hypothetical protein [Streptomyces sp. 891-h]|uniref:hypothetical protein n=1 Tax=Streptomyces sp. 891-h TaxID=2720714 RepID=UPI001FAA8CF2|nr:hypothetical protein [Streptomyces sp. 891-h]